MEKFSFSSALMHFQNTKGPGSFVWKWLLTAFIAMTLLFGGSMFMTFDMMAGFGITAPGQTVPVTNEEAFAFIGRMFGTMAILVPLTVVVMAVLEASALRRYIRNEAFSIRFGKDELRVIGVYLWWALMVLVAMIIMVILGLIIGMFVMIIAAGLPMAAPFLALIFNLATYLGLLALAVRFAPASAVTIRDNKVTFFEAEAATKGRFWPLFGAFLIPIVAYYVLSLVLQLLLLMPVMTSMATQNDASFTPTLFVMMGVSTVISGNAFAFMMLVNLGITSRAAITDESWSGRGGEVAETFE